MIDIKMSPEYQRYFKELEENLQILYEVAEKARAKGFDPSQEPEPRVTMDIAERIEKLIGPPGISKRMRELEDMDRREMAFKVAEEIALGRFGALEKEEAADQAIRTSLAIITEGVTIAPIQGIPEIRIKNNLDGSQYLAVYLAGPIRPAGGTAQALTLVLADHVRRKLGLERFYPSNDVVNRFIEEVRIYEREVRRFQYHVTDDDLEHALKNIPVEATGVSTDSFEVSNYRNVTGIETNRLRGGALIVVVDGIVGRARKLCGICESLGLEGWEWLNRMGQNNSDNDEKTPTAGFMEEIIVGRPVFAFPNTIGGFRLRYGRSRTTGLAAVGIHPATMKILNGFLTTGVQLRIELPGKSASVCPVDTIEPPIVKLSDGSVIRVENEEEADKIYDRVEKILFNGDVLVNAGDFIQNNKPLLPSGYDEDQWILELKQAFHKDKERFCARAGLEEKTLQKLLIDPFSFPTPDEALAISKTGVSLHPRYTYDWSKITKEELLKLRTTLAQDWENKAPYAVKMRRSEKEILERLLIQHGVDGDYITFSEAGPILDKCLQLDTIYVETKGETPLEVISSWAGFPVKNKAQVYVGARMGRPEKAKERRMNPYVHALFPIGNAGGPQRDITKPKRRESIRVELVKLVCPECGHNGTSVLCQNCGANNVVVRRCRRCNKVVDSTTCPVCGNDTVAYDFKEINLRSEIENALKHIGGTLPSRIKCVKRLMNEKRIPENICKGIIRARYDLSVFKDGTLRFDLTDIPLTHFKPEEVGVPIEKLKELGYTRDVNGDPLTRTDQMLELMVQDIVLPEDCGDYLVTVTRFIDDELRDFYKIEPFYNVKKRDDLIGHLILGLAPHTSAAIVGRIIGYTTVRNCYAHPYWHAAKRRNCDGDEDAVMMVLDPLLNFSRSYLPEQSGGLMDAPLFIIPNLNPSEIDKEAHNVDVINRYPPEFYRLCKTGANPSEYGPLVDTLGNRIGTGGQLQGFSYTRECSNLNLGSHIGAYNKLNSMFEKLESQLDLSDKLVAVNTKIVATKILNSHFMKDIVGNLRAFTRQRFRCTKCNKKFRRPPLKGKCDRCGGNILLTVYKGGIEKYLESALNIVKKYGLEQYYLDRLELVVNEIKSIFPEDEFEEESHTQYNLTDFMRSQQTKTRTK